MREALDEIKRSDVLTPYVQSRLIIIDQNFSDMLEDEYDRGWLDGYDNARDTADMYT